MHKLNRRGAEMAMIHLMEIVLASIVVTAIILTVFHLTSGSAYRRELLAKDNAHLIDALHATPNGEMRVAYLWKSTSHALTLSPGSTTVQAIDDKATDRVALDGFTKAFGTQSGVNVQSLGPFQPAYFAYVISPIADKRTLAIDRSFNDIACPSSSDPLGGLSVTSRLNDLTGETPSAFSESLFQGAQLRYNNALSREGTSLLINAMRYPTPEAKVAYASIDDRTVRLACVIAQKLRSEGVTVSFSHASQLSNAPSSGVYIMLSVPDESALEKLREVIISGIAAYADTGGSQ